jgi:hypothetical protein
MKGKKFETGIARRLCVYNHLPSKTFNELITEAQFHTNTNEQVYVF